MRDGIGLEDGQSYWSREFDSRKVFEAGGSADEARACHSGTREATIEYHASHAAAGYATSGKHAHATAQEALSPGQLCRHSAMSERAPATLRGSG